LPSCCCCALFAWDATVNSVPVPCCQRDCLLRRGSDGVVWSWRVTQIRAPAIGGTTPAIRRSQIYSNTICFQTR
jgi:hypothetical protein